MPLPETFWWWVWARRICIPDPELAQKYEQLFHQPEAFLKLGNRLLVLPVLMNLRQKSPVPSPRQSMTAKITLLHGR